MIGILLSVLFPKYESRAALKEDRERWRKKTICLTEKAMSVKLESEHWKALAEFRANEIDYLHGLIENLTIGNETSVLPIKRIIS